jgi:SAM-dependent methyltransferase
MGVRPPDTWPSLNRLAPMMNSGTKKDRWIGANSYDLFMGRWSRELGRAFVLWLAVPPERHWLEVGCGTGALTSRISELCSPSSVVATDPSEQFLAHARASIPDQRVEFIVAGVEHLPVRPNAYDAVVSSLVLNFLPNPAVALGEMRALTAKDGIVGACVWDYADGMQFLRRFWDAAVALDLAASEYDEGDRFPICSPPGLESVFRQAGFSRVDVEALEIPTHFRDFDDYWQPFIDGPGPAPGYLSSLPTDKQRELARRLQTTLPRQDDGSIQLTARAWAARAHGGGAA